MPTGQSKKSFGSYGFNTAQKIIRAFVWLGVCRGKLSSLAQKLWNSCSLPGSTFDIEYHGIRLRVAPCRNTVERKILLNSKFRDKKEIQAILEMPADGVFVDIGANIGYYSMMIAHEYRHARIIAFEPNPELYKMLCDNIKFNNLGKQITAIQAAVGDAAGSATLTFPGGDYGSGSINPQAQRQSDQQLRDIEIVPLLKSLQDLGIAKIHALKIDIEGYEDKALMPYFREADSNNWPAIIVIEDNQVNLWQEDIIKYMTGHGYQQAGKTRGNVIFTRP